MKKEKRNWMKGDLAAKKPHAEIYELSDIRKQDLANMEKYSDCIRVYCSQAPDVFHFQIRTHKPTTEPCKKKGKDRFMLAQVNLTLAELEQILTYCKGQYQAMKEIDPGPLDLIPSDES